MKKVWKPIDLGGLRLYEVRLTWHPPIKHPNCKLSVWKAQAGTTEIFIVAATAPRFAAEQIERIYKDSYDNNPNISYWHVRGYALNILQPADWNENGIPCLDCEPERWRR